MSIITKLSDIENIPIFNNHNYDQKIGSFDDFYYQGKRLCISPGYIQREDGTIEILEFSIYERDAATGKIINN